MSSIRELMRQAVDLHRGGKLAQAEQLYREVLSLQPDQPDALHLLGVLANQSGKPEVGAKFIRRALAIQPAEAEYHSSLAASCKETGAVASAVAHYREALRLKPDSAKAHIYLCDALMELGEFDEALAHSLEALRLEPESALAFCTLGELAAHGFYRFSAAEIVTMQRLAADRRLLPRDASLLYFTLAAHWEKNSDCDQAFACYRLANELKREVYRQSGQVFDPQRHRTLIDNLIATFTPELFERTRSFGCDSDLPIFVVGMVRSGTSLVEQILASLPGVFGAGELKDIDQIANALPGRVGTHMGFPQCITSLDQVTAAGLARLYLDRLAHKSGGARRVVDKMPHNYLYLGLIGVLFPRARIVHCRRDSLDVCWAAYAQNFKWLTYASSLEEIGFYYRQYERLMEHWRGVLPVPMHEIAYETLVADQETVSRSLVAFCGLEWHDCCFDFHKSKRTVQTSSKLQVRQPLFTRSVGRSRRFEAHLQPLRDALADPDARVVSLRADPPSTTGAAGDRGSSL